MTQRKAMAVLPALVLALSSLAIAADNDAINLLKSTGALDRLAKESGVYNASSTGKTPGFIVDPSFPQLLPHNWLLGQVGGLYVDQHNHIWVYNRPRTMTNDEAGLEKAVPGATDAKGQPVNALGLVRANGFVADCCNAAPSVLEFDAAGKLLRSWGGPSDPGFLGGKCKAEAGLHLAQQRARHLCRPDMTTSGLRAMARNVPRGPHAWTTNKQGGDGFVLKFDMDGNFKMRIGGTPTGPDSNDTNSGINGTPTLYGRPIWWWIPQPTACMSPTVTAIAAS